MRRLKSYLALLRVSHYVKNFIIFLPAMLTFQLRNPDVLLVNIKGFMIFSLTASIIYILNDIKDLDSDRRHPLKSSRPIASGKISVCQAVIVMIILALSVLVLWWSVNFALEFIAWPAVYFVLNVMYSFHLKNIPLLDVCILSSCYVIRLLYGASISAAQISNWMSVTMMSASFFMGFGKRRNEFLQYGKSMRKSLNGYSEKFLDKSLQITLTSSIIFYSLMCADNNTAVMQSGVNLLWTVPIVTVICLRYLMLVEDDKCDGDPTSIILRDKILTLLCLGYILSVGILLYIPLS